VIQTIAVIDYGMGNLRSVAKAAEHVSGTQTQVVITSDAATVQAADRVIFPGQGAMGDCMAALASRGLDRVIRDVLSRKPFLGVCVGFQALLDESEEDGGTPGLGLLPGSVRRFADGQRDEKTNDRLKVPHMGWNEVVQQQPHPLWSGIPDRHRFYFVHSYYVDPLETEVTSGTTDYGVRFTAAAAGPSWFATQFHPEKSADAGLQLLRNFVTWNGST
jgi:imidazole glycerol-phosphate synthase subunit HisH